MKPRDYCCCALPIIDAGIYATLTEQFVLGIVVGALSLATPSIVGAVTPAVAPWILGIVCFIASAVQGFGFIGVAKEKPITFRRYLTLHILTTTAAFSIALVWIIMSATRHSTAQSRCESKFFPSAPNTPTSSEGQVICNIFPWVHVGVMGGLWILLACVQFYLYLVLSSYGSRQQRDHATFGSDYDPTHPLTSDIPMTDRNRSWDAGADKPFSAPRGGYGHVRQESVSSVTEYQYHGRGASYSSAGYGEYDDKGPKVSRGQSVRGNGYPDQPAGAHTVDPGPTPVFSESYYTGDNTVAADVNRPLPSQPHPAEGSFHRKTPKAR